MTVPLVIAVLLGAAAALATWSFRDRLLARIRQDVDWLSQVAARFTPRPVDARKWVWAFYVVQFFVLLPIAVLLAPVPLTGLGLWLGVWMVPRLAARQLWQRRKDKIREQLPAAVRKLSTAVGAGLSPAEAFRQLGEEAPMPIRYEFQIIARQWELGADLNSALEAAARRLDLQGVRLFASTLIINNRMGGNLVDTLERLAASLESLAEMREEVHAATAEGRANMYVLVLAPVLMLVLVAFMDSDAVVDLLTTPLGWVFLIPAIALTAIGVLWARAVVKVRV